MAHPHVETRFPKRGTKREGMNGPRESWVDLNEGYSSRRSKSGLTVLANTPQRSRKTRELVGSQSYPQLQGETELFRSQVLLQEKAAMSDIWTGKEMSHKENGESDQSKTSKNKSVTFQIEDSTSTTALQLQVSALRQALEQAGTDKNALRDLLTKEKEQSGYLNIQLLEERHKNRIEKDKKLRDKEEEIEGLKTRISQLRQELVTMSQIAKKTQVDSTNEAEHQELQGQLREKEELLKESERERNALNERLTALEVERQLSMIKYQEEMETSVMAVTTQLEELLDLNKQLQVELTHLQTERDGLNLSLENERKSKDLSTKEKDKQLAIYKDQVQDLTLQLQRTKEKLAEQIQYKTDHSSLSTAFELTKKELEGQIQDREDALNQIALLTEENKSLKSQLETASSQNDKAKTSCKRLREELRAAREDLTNAQREKGAVDAQLVTMQAELVNSQKQCSQLKTEIDEMVHAHHKINSLMMQQTEQLQSGDESIKLLKNSVKELKKELEGANSAQAKLKSVGMSTQSQIESLQASNQNFRQKIIELEGDLASQKKLSIELREQLEQKHLVSETKQCQIEELKETIEKLQDELTTLQEECKSANVLQTKLLTVQNIVASLQLERGNLSKRLKEEMEQARLVKESKQKLKEENKRLRERLGGNVTPTNLSNASPAGMNSSSTPPPSPPPLSFSANDSSTNPLTPSYAIHSSPPKYTPSLEFSSPGAEILNLRHQLAEARLAVRNLEQQNSKTASEMAKVQGSMEAMTQLLDHLNEENKSLNGFMVKVEEEKEGYKQELAACHERLEVVKSDVNVFLSRTYAQLMSLARELDEFKKPKIDDQEKHQDEERKRLGMLEKLRMAASMIRNLASSVVGTPNEGDTENDAFGGGEDFFQADNLYSSSLEEVQALEERVTVACEKLKEMEALLEEKERELEGKERELGTLRETSKLEEGGARHRSTEDRIESMKKDLETQYQAKLAVLRNKLVEREDEVNALKSTEQELRTTVGDAEVTLTSNAEEMATAKEELLRLRELVHSYEASLSSEAHLIECESETQLHSLNAMKKELGRIKSECSTKNTDNGGASNEEGEESDDVRSKEAKLRSCNERIFELQGQVESLKAKKSIFNRYIQSQEESEESIALQQRNELMQQSTQLREENDELKSELLRLNEAIQQLQDNIEIMALRLEEAREEAAEREREASGNGRDDSNDLEGSLQDRSALLQENAQLTQENEEMRIELHKLNEATLGMQDKIDIMALRLEEVQEEAFADQDEEEEEEEEDSEKVYIFDVDRVRSEVLTRRDEYELAYSDLDLGLKTKIEELKEARAEIERLSEEVKTLKEEMEIKEESHHDTVAKWRELLEKKDASLANARLSLERTMADKELLELQLSGSASIDSSTHSDAEKKISKLKSKFKTQVKKNNELRIKLGYILSELRLFKQLKVELDCQVYQLQQALKISKDQYKECLRRLNHVEINHFTN